MKLLNVILISLTFLLTSCIPETDKEIKEKENNTVTYSNSVTLTTISENVTIILIGDFTSRSGRHREKVVYKIIDNKTNKEYFVISN